MYTFKGGTHINEYKLTKDYALEEIDAPDRVAISMSQHIGAPCTPCVEAGEEVLVGQIIGKVDDGALGCPVHASVSGKVAGRRTWQPTPVFLPGEPQGRGSLVGCRSMGSHRVGHN